jgi:hypothetical protein
VSERPLTVYFDAALVAGSGHEDLALASELGLLAVVVDGPAMVPADLTDAWHLTDRPPEAGSTRWARTVLIGPRPEAGRRPLTGLRTARNARLAVLEIAAEHVQD